MNDQRRMAVALGFSLVVHVVTLAYVNAGRGPGGPVISFGTPPTVIDFDRSQPAARFVDTVGTTEEPVDPSTDLISDKNSKASDMSDRSDESDGRPAPHFDTPSDFDRLGGPVAPPPASAASLLEPAQESQAAAPPETTPEESKPPRRKETAPAPPPAGIQDQVLEALKKAETPQANPQEESQAPEGPFEMAKSETADAATSQPGTATPPQPVPPVGEGKTEGRAGGGVEAKGFLGFEAMKNDFAPYLKIVRDAVESHWRRTLQLRYSGASKTQAVVDCAISPEGRLVSVAIVEPGSSATFAEICKESIETAAPFPPFPFQVPSMYRTKNLEIHWTFSFM